MDNNFKTSFIPKKPLSPGSLRPKHAHNIFSIIAGIIFVATLLLTAGVVFWHSYTQKTIDRLQAETEEAKGSFDPALISELERLGSRVETAQRLLDDHLAFSNFFDALAEITLKTVGYTSFGYSQNGQKVTVNMGGEAESFAALALQADEYAAGSKVLSNPSISNLVLQKNGHVTFSVTFLVNPALVSYTKNVVVMPEIPIDAPVQASSTTATSSQPQ